MSAFWRAHRGLEIDLLRDLQSVVDLNTEVSDCAFQLVVTQEQLAGAEVSGFLIDQRHLGPPKAMCAVRTGVEIDHTNPAVDEARVLACSDMPAGIAAAWEQPIVRPLAPEFKPVRQRVSRRLCDLERYGPTGLLLDDGGALSNDTSVGNVREPQLDEAAAPELCIQRGVEHRQISDRSK